MGLALTMKKENRTELATFGAGCFWGIEEKLRTTRGVESTQAGYMGGWLEKPTYEEVCTRKTGHAEVVQVEFNPNNISYGKLLEIFFSSHDPTTPNRDGPNIGTQYRSIIFFYSKEQEKQAKGMKEKLEKEKRFSKPIITEILSASTFWKAEEYHQKYLMKRGAKACHF
jgi:peptide-methionine (S)-S-oxide reductase